MSSRTSTRDGRAGYRESLARLQGAQKSSKGAPAYSRFINRPLGRRFAALAHVLGWTPNQVTALSATCSGLGIALVALVPPTWWTGLLVTVLLVLGYALDSSDGQLARLRGGGSLEGEWLDHTIDAAKISLLHLAVTVSVYRWFDLEPGWTLVPLGFVLVANVMFFGMILRDLLIARYHARHGGAPTRGTPSTLRSVLVLPTDYGLLCVSFLLLGVPALFFPAYALLLAATAGFLILALPKWFRDVREAGERR